MTCDKVELGTDIAATEMRDDDPSSVIEPICLPSARIARCGDTDALDPGDTSCQWWEGASEHNHDIFSVMQSDETRV